MVNPTGFDGLRRRLLQGGAAAGALALLRAPAYLRGYPSGVFSEVAQFRLDHVLALRGEKKIVATNTLDNPFSRGTGRLDLRYNIGYRYQYRDVDPDTKAEKRTYTWRVTAVTDTEVAFNDGRFVMDLLGNTRRQPDSDVVTQTQYYIPEYSVGKKWTTRYKIVKPDGRAFHGEYEFRTTSRSMVSVPAGDFNAFHVEGNGFGDEVRTRLKLDYWIAPDVARFVVRTYHRINRAGTITNRERTELMAYPRR